MKNQIGLVFWYYLDEKGQHSKYYTLHKKYIGDYVIVGGVILSEVRAT